jgi:hypothetical protein
LIFKKAKKIMDDISASFIFTGEVLGQRPMSQRKKAIKLTEKESCLEGLIVRPLSAKLLEPTVPEKEGILDRNNFFGIQGKSRKPQIKLASLFKIKEYHAPAGGCRLTEPGFSRRVKDLMKFNLDFNLRDIKLLKIGRHFRLSPDAKLILGRNETENGLILNYFKKGDLLFLPENVPGPSGLGIGNFSRTDLKKSFEIIAFYSIGSLKNKDGRKVSIKYKKKGCSDTLLKFVLPAQKETFKNMLI